MRNAGVATGLLVACACSSASPAGTAGRDAGGGDAGGSADGATLGDTDGGASAFVGVWSCHGTAPLVVTAPPSLAGTYQASDVYLLSLTSSTAGSLAEVVGGLDGGVYCTKMAVVTGSTADFAGQTCPLDFNGTALTETFTSGTLTVNGNTMTEMGSGSVAGTIAIDGGTSAFAGTTSFSGNCTK